jgi:ribonuclease P protein component
MAAVPMIRTSSDFQRAARQGKRWTTSSFILQAFDRGDALPCRLGLTASRKVGNAVVRNRAKRRLKSMMRLFLNGRDLPGLDIVLIAKTEAARAVFTIMQSDLLRAIDKTTAKPS